MPLLKEYAVFEVRIPIESTSQKVRESILTRAYNDIINQIRIKRSWKVRLDRMEKNDGTEPKSSSNQTVIRNLAHVMSNDYEKARTDGNNDHDG